MFLSHDLPDRGICGYLSKSEEYFNCSFWRMRYSQGRVEPSKGANMMSNAIGRILCRFGWHRLDPFHTEHKKLYAGDRVTCVIHLKEVKVRCLRPGCQHERLVWTVS